MRFDGTDRGFRYSSGGACAAAYLPEVNRGLPHTCSGQKIGGAIIVDELFGLYDQWPQAPGQPAMEIARTAARQASGARGERCFLRCLSHCLFLSNHAGAAAPDMSARV